MDSMGNRFKKKHTKTITLSVLLSNINQKLQACVDVSHHTLIGVKLFDWDRTGEHDALGRFDI